MKKQLLFIVFLGFTQHYLSAQSFPIIRSAAKALGTKPDSPVPAKTPPTSTTKVPESPAADVKIEGRGKFKAKREKRKAVNKIVKGLKQEKKTIKSERDIALTKNERDYADNKISKEVRDKNESEIQNKAKIAIADKDERIMKISNGKSHIVRKLKLQNKEIKNERNAALKQNKKDYGTHVISDEVYKKNRNIIQKSANDKISNNNKKIINIREDNFEDNKNRLGILPALNPVAARLFFYDTTSGNNFNFAERISTRISPKNGAINGDLVSAISGPALFRIQSQFNTSLKKVYSTDPTSNVIILDSLTLKEMAFTNLINGGGNFNLKSTIPLFYLNKKDDNDNSKFRIVSEVSPSIGILVSQVFNTENPLQLDQFNPGINFSISGSILGTFNVSNKFILFAGLDSQFTPTGNNIFFQEILLEKNTSDNKNKIGYYSGIGGFIYENKISASLKFFHSYYNNLQNQPISLDIVVQPGFWGK